MAYILCKTDEGLRPSDVTVEVRDVDSRPDYLRVRRAFVKFFDNHYYIPIGIVHRQKDVFLIELPHEADSGRNRLWAPSSSMRESPFQPAAVP